MYYAFDIETTVGDDAVIRSLVAPFVKPAPPGPFDRAAVKVGNLKDQAKIDAKIEEAHRDHLQAVANYADDCAAAEKRYWDEVYGKAALDPTTGRIVVVGVMSQGGSVRFIDGDEPDILSAWWSRWEELMMQGARFLGSNSRDFDLPYLVRRSWINGVPVPESVVDQGRYWHKCFHDVRQHWLLGQRYADCHSSLDYMARALGVGEKLPGEIGAHFGKYWNEDREKAKNYLTRDLELTLSIARRLGLIQEKAA